MFSKKASAQTSPPLYSPDRNVLLLDWDGVMSPYDINFAAHYYKTVSKISRNIARREIENGIHPEQDQSEVLRGEQIRQMAMEDMVFGRHNDDYLVQRSGKSRDALMQDFRDVMYANPDFPAQTPPDLVQAMALAHKKNGLRIIVVSHSDTESLKKAIERRGVGALIGENDIIGIDRLKGHKKNEGDSAYNEVFRQCEIEPGQAMTLDDSSKNLEQAKKLGIETISVSKVSFANLPLHRLRSKHDYIDRYHKDALEFFKAYNQEIETGKEYSPSEREKSAGIL